MHRWSSKLQFDRIETESRERRVAKRDTLVSKGIVRLIGLVIRGMQILLSIALLCSLASAQDFGRIDDSAIPVSLIAIIADPHKWHGEVVRVTGVIVIEHEGNALYLSREHRRMMVLKNAIWLDFDETVISVNELADVDERYAVVEGRVNANMQGHFGMYSAALENVSRVLLRE